MAKPKTLNNISDLESSGYGQPHPRHGLHLLHWFCNDFITFDNNGDLEASTHPKSREYGFHYFGNRPELDGEPLLPQENLPYHAVGNLFAAGADDLPEYVRLNFTRDSNLSNMDRIIIQLHAQLRVGKVYVTQHLGSSSFDRQHTYRISKGLVRVLSNLDLEEGLLWKVGYLSNTVASLMVSRWQETQPARVNKPPAPHPAKPRALHPAPAPRPSTAGQYPARVPRPSTPAQYPGSGTSKGAKNKQHYSSARQSRDMRRSGGDDVSINIPDIDVMAESRPGRCCNCVIL